MKWKYHTLGHVRALPRDFLPLAQAHFRDVAVVSTSDEGAGGTQEEEEEGCAKR